MSDLGNVGEADFKKWCHQADLAVNVAFVDKTGWDFIVEFPLESSLAIRDIHTSPIQCKVQVKSTKSRRRKLSIELSNLKRLATDPKPAFIVFIEYDEDDEAESAYLVHFDEELVSRVLKRLHEIEQGEEVKKLNETTMTVKYGEQNKMEFANGRSLKKEILSCVSGRLDDYVEKKLMHLKTCGYESGAGKLTFKANCGEDLNSLVEMSLGLRDQVEISNVIGFEERFGIPAKQPFTNEDRGFLSLSVEPDGECILIFKESKLSPGLSFRASLYKSPFNPGVPDSYKAIRLKGSFF
ncbi:hypothetical protein ABE957_08760 [Halomonas sp. CS7]|uniref:DUF4365 domain-containing protein n=1 Tax=Halomonas pelophila TaxID=3151122 RepID=A0ABV1N4W4_9GAMM